MKIFIKKLERATDHDSFIATFSIHYPPAFLLFKAVQAEILTES
jgi:hypothetical protein